MKKELGGGGRSRGWCRVCYEFVFWCVLVGVLFWVMVCLNL